MFIALNGFFVAAEFALVKVGTSKLSARAKQDPKARRAHEVVSNLERYLSVTQLGITVASLGLGWVGEPAMEHAFVALIQRLTGHEPGGALKIAAMVAALTLLTYGHVLFGELVPKLVAIQRSEQTALSVAGPLHLIYVAFRPLLFGLEASTKLLLRALGMSADAASEGKLSEEEILGILVANTAKSPGGVEKSELVQRVIRFSQRAARHAMVPRVDVKSLPIETTGVDAVALLRDLQYSRIVLTRGRSLDDVAGYLYAKDVFLSEVEPARLDLASLRRDVLFVPEQKGLLDLLRQMQKTQIPIAVVIDEYGGSSGIVTLEDLLEEIVGEIRDEFDEEPSTIVRDPNAPEVWDVDARANMEDLRTIGVEVETKDAAEAISTVIQERIGRIPRTGDKVELGPLVSVEVSGMSRRRITSVRVRVKVVTTP
ncbi:MAG: HlyC/CorC family transporter [Myxococcales bacterium]|nr:HlyC/CorC family transporter [Myxococcales bacterium]MBL0196017.1 HlyC/CorC family transporter [Myxococcales bacterium]HQY61114.1 hemolysin family protein [Polyangiaceae bacterium]